MEISDFIYDISKLYITFVRGVTVLFITAAFVLLWLDSKLKNKK